MLSLKSNLSCSTLGSRDQKKWYRARDLYDKIYHKRKTHTVETL